ncbi:MAG: hypothetical protein JRN26_06530 [Nitrososphaerota archaeon]|jgi:hypothetical protein|nr:hypothetical protein [Nitrososphaerota archaeon]MDG6936518.1 hypothetical protein [Nitrososphaerota archaeon]MDG6944993.1 hypothetical protein [Nitrososphaerota archaeon]
MIDYYVISIAVILVIVLYSWLLSRYGMLTKAMDRLGTALVIAFIVLLLASAILFSYGREGLANQLSEYAYFAILAGVIAKVAALRKSESKA